MPGHSTTRDHAKPGGLFDGLSKIVIRWPLLVVGLWLAASAAMVMTLPSLHSQAAKGQQSPLPDTAPSIAVNRQLGRTFHEIEGGSLLFVVLTDDHGLSPSDENVYRRLIDNLRHDTQDRILVQDFLSTPALRKVFESKDNKAWNLPINLPGDGPSAATQEAYRRVAEIVKTSVTGTSLTASLTGPVATIADFQRLGAEDSRVIEIGTVISVLAILFVVYRNFVTMLIPIATIGVSVLFAQGTLSALAELGLALNMQVIGFISAVMIGAGTDYAVFLISRYHDCLRQGLDSDQAVKRAMLSIGKVIFASAATVAVTFLAMVFTRLKVFSAVGPATAVSIAVSLLAAVTLLPAILVLTGRRGWINPRRELTTRFWRRSGSMIARRPARFLIGSLAALLALAGTAGLAHLSFDDVRFLPREVGSVAGYEQINRHFPMNAMTPAVLLVQSPRDMRTPAALADLEAMANRISELPEVAMVRGLTRPFGEPVEQMTASFQTGEVGGKLNQVSAAISDRTGDLDTLAGSSRHMAGELARIRERVMDAMSGADKLLTALEELQGVLTASPTSQQLAGAAQILGRMTALSGNLSATVSGARQVAGWAGPIVAALSSSPVCSADSACIRSRDELASLVAAENDGTLGSIAALAASFREMRDPATVTLTTNKLAQQLSQAINFLKTAGGLRSRMAQMTQGASALADGGAAVADGVQQLVERTKQLGTGLSDASTFLLDIKHDAHRRSMTGFYIPAQFMDTDEYRSGTKFFLSDDGHSARYFVQSALNPFTAQAMDQIGKIIDAAKSTQPNTELVDASIAMTGITAGLKDTHDYYRSDMEFIFIATVIIVFLILAALLRALVAPLYLIVSVLISYLSALGLSVIAFQLLLGQDLHWSLPGLSFVCLVAVGADYNMLLISRIREESEHGVRAGVIRTVGATGGVITSAGMIFAASMFSLVTASITTMVQAGFTIGIGILLDTFLVRTATVPALVALIGRASWWPLGAEFRYLRHVGRLMTPNPQGRFSRIVPTYFRSRFRSANLPATAASITSRAKREKPGESIPHRGMPERHLGIHALPLFGCGDKSPLLLHRSKAASTRAGAARHLRAPRGDTLQHALPLFDLRNASMAATVNRAARDAH
ncbi:RND family transporter [Mycobacterium gordonae]|nr:RND family transporter [Mycobacterium gordonae]MCV7005064.1 RND family transporter [Mycobacterium gordonae]